VKTNQYYCSVSSISDLRFSRRCGRSIPRFTSPVKLRRLIASCNQWRLAGRPRMPPIFSHSDLHNYQVKHQLTAHAFIQNMRGASNSDEVTDALVLTICESIKDEQFTLMHCDYHYDVE
jgi:hypothetical protein